MKRAGDRFGRLFFYDIFEQKSQPLTHESSSVGARPSSDAPFELYPGKLETERVFDGACSDRRAFVC